MVKGPHSIYELYGTGVSGKRSSKKYLSRIHCRRKSHGQVQSKRKNLQSRINTLWPALVGEAARHARTIF